MYNDLISQLEMGLLRFSQKQNMGDKKVTMLGRRKRRELWIDELTNELNYSCDSFKFIDLTKILNKAQRTSLGDIEVRDFSGKTAAYLNLRCCADYVALYESSTYTGLPSLDMNYSRNLQQKELYDNVPRISLLVGKSVKSDFTISMIGIIDVKDAWTAIEERKNWCLAAHALGDNEWREFYNRNIIKIVEVEQGSKLRVSA